jgi:hypothetical protein
MHTAQGTKDARSPPILAPVLNCTMHAPQYRHSHDGHTGTNRVAIGADQHQRRLPATRQSLPFFTRAPITPPATASSASCVIKGGDAHGIAAGLIIYEVNKVFGGEMSGAQGVSRICPGCRRREPRQSSRSRTCRRAA